MQKIVRIVLAELAGTKPNLDTIKMCVRIAIASSNMNFTSAESCEIVGRIADSLEV